MSRLKALDIVLLPSEDIIDLAIDLNQSFKNRTISLSKKTAMPHISLAMAVIKEDNEKQIVQEFQEIKNSLPDIELVVDHLFEYKSDSGDVVGFGIKKNKELQDLHLESIKLLKKFHCITELGNKNIFQNSNNIISTTPADWVLGFIDNHSADNFDPHITLGYGSIELNSPLHFKTKSLCLYHLGPHCTCHTKIF